MARAGALKRVRADLAAGRTYVAVQRLRSMIAENPGDLEARALLAAVHRRTGNLVEAGRWSYLTDEITPAELVAFSRAHASPWVRLRMLHYPGTVAELPSEAARNRLGALIVAARQAGPPPRPTAPVHPAGGGRPRRRRRPRSRPGPRPDRSARFPCLYVSIVLFLFGVLVLIGILRVAAWVVGFLNS